jgi:hypothetical protein
MKSVFRGALCAALWAVVPALALWTPPASASVSIELSLDRLASGSDAVVVGTPVERHAFWRGGRIFTYCRLRVDVPIAGSLRQGDEIWLRTRGGIVGDVGQRVEGEAILAEGVRTLVFLRGAGDGAMAVHGRAQGQFRLVPGSDAVERLQQASNLGALVPDRRQLGSPPEGARRALAGKPLDDAAALIAEAWRHGHDR